jgi:multiple sugar transport system permease protein
VAKASRAGYVRVGILVVLGLIWLAPSYLMIVNAARPAGSFDPAHAWTPAGHFDLLTNIRRAWDSAQIGDGLGSTLLYSVISPALAIGIGALAGYGIVTLRLRHGFAWFMLIFGGTIFPSQMLLVPLFTNYSRFNLYDTRQGLILIYTVISVPLAAFVMRNFFTGVAFSIFEAARLDGASTFRVFWRIYLPLSWPALAAVFVLEFTFTWNDLIFGLTLSQSDSIRPVMTAVSALQSDVYAGTPVPVALAVGLLVSIPAIVLFLATQRFFTRGLTLGQL